jgi:DNA-binding NarL/FixJ family response regulator
MYRPRVLLADDHAQTAELLRTLLRTEFDVIALVEDGGALVSAAEQLSPDAIVADISMPILGGIEAAEFICRRDPDARIVLVTVHTDRVLVERGLAAGAMGYVLKDSAGDELLAAVYAAIGGERFVSCMLGGLPGELRSD